MHFKLIFFLFINLFYAQSLYESSVGINSSSMSARSTALGSTAVITDISALSISSNPSNMITSNNLGLSIISSYKGTFIAERRGMVVKDYFGDYLAEADYVKNSSIINSLTFGANYNFQIKDFDVSTGISIVPYNIFNYSYEEEVRGNLPSVDGNIFSRDPLLGYHILNSTGNQKLYSIGHALKFDLMNIVASIGYGYNMLDQSTINEEVYVDTIVAEDNLELSLISPYSIDYKLNKVSFSSFGCNLKFKQILFNFSFKDEFIINKTMSNESYVNLESYLSEFSLLHGSNELALHYFFDYFESKLLDKIYKPKTYNISLALLDASNQNFNFIINYEKNIYDTDYVLSNYERYSIGVEHFGFNNIPLRFGIQYMSSPFKPYISSSSVVSFGSGFNMNSNLTLDYAVDYKSINYMFPDLFPVEDESRPDLDVVNESETNFIITMSYNF